MRALERVFRIFDRDRDGVLSDDELNAFQVLRAATLDSRRNIWTEAYIHFFLIV